MNNKLLAIAASFSSLLFCAPHANAAGWYSGSIKNVELTSLGEILLFLEAPSNHECGSKRVDYVTPNDAPGRSMLAALLAWQAQGKGVRVYIASCNGSIGLFNTIIDE
jgi:hypothetical protein